MLIYLIRDLLVQVRGMERVLAADPEILQWSTVLQVPLITIDDREVGVSPLESRRAYCRKMNDILVRDETPMVLTAHFTMTRPATSPNQPEMTLRLEGRLLEALPPLTEQTINIKAEINYRNVENMDMRRRWAVRGRGYNMFNRLLVAELNGGRGYRNGFNQPPQPEVIHSFNWRFKTEEMNIQLAGAAKPNRPRTDAFVEAHFEIPSEIGDFWQEVLLQEFERFAINMELSLSFPVDDDILTQDEDGFGELAHSNSVILEEGLASDVTIVASNGAEIAAHKCFLIVNSLVLAAMFIGDRFQESRTNRIEMMDASEQCIRAFLEFIYTFKITKGRNCPQLAVELLEMAHKYNVPPLERTMEAILKQRPIVWFDFESAFYLFLFARKVDKYSELKTKAGEVLKLNPEDLWECKDFMELLKEGHYATVREILAAIDLLCLCP